MKHFRTLQPDELARMAETNVDAQQYILDNAFELLTGAAESSEAIVTEAYNSGHDDGLYDGRRKLADAISDKHGSDIEEAMASLMGKYTEPEKLPKKRRRAWELFGHILHSLEYL